MRLFPKKGETTLERERRHWLAFANARKCNHYASLKETGFINWVKEGNNFQIGDIVYLFSSSERKIIFKTIVTGEEMRRDSKYWVEKAPKDLTWRLEKVKENTGDDLDESLLIINGFKGGRSIQHPLYRNKELLDYIDSCFENM